MAITIKQDNTAKALSELDKSIARAIEKIGLAAEGYAKRLCPVDTGRLRNSITHAVDSGDKSVAIGTNVEYAAAVELGSSRSKAQPYLRPAATNHEKDYSRILEAELKNG